MGLRPGFSKEADKKQEAQIYARITQESFDAVVQENIDEFDMAPDEALEDAVAQFTSQGVNLSNIVQRVPGGDPADDPQVIVLCRKLEELLSDSAEDEETLEINYGGGIMKIVFRVVSAEVAVEFAETAAALRTECSDKEKANLAGHRGAVDSLVSVALSLIRSPSALAPVLECLACVLHDAEARERLGARGIAALTALMRAHPKASGVVRSGFHAARAAMLVHEANRQAFVTSAGLLKLVPAALSEFASEPSTFLAIAGAMRATTLSDDARSRASKGIEHAKTCVELGVLPDLLNAAKSDMAKSPSALAELLATLSRLAVTDTICSQLARMDALRLAINELANHMTDAAVAKQACFFLANISGNDQCKGSIVAGHGHIAIIQAMLLHPNHAGMQTDAVAALGNMMLRMPLNCEAIAEAGGIGPLVTAMTVHVAYPRMQSKGPLAVRNMVGRNPELVPAIIEAGAEGPLREIMNSNEEGYVHNTAKAALRELHLDVHLKEVFQGKIGEAFSIEQGDADGENHWDKFLDTPVAQEAIKREFEAMGVVPEAAY